MLHRIYSLLGLSMILFQSAAQVNPKPSSLILNKEELSVLDSITMILYGENNYTHTISTRVGFTNKALFAGRNYGINQSLTTLGAMYSHRSGFYTDLTAYAYSESNPRHELTMASLGYVGTIGKKIIYLGEYSHSFFTQPDSNSTFRNSINLYGGYDIGKFTTALSFSMLLDKGNVSGLFIPSISRPITTPRIGIVDKITFSPALSATIGKSNSFSNTFNPLESGNPYLNGTFPIDTAKLRASGWQGGRPSWVGSGGTRPNGTSGPPAWVLNNQYPGLVEDKISLMSYTLSVPVSVKIKNINFNFTPNITKPIQTNYFELTSPKPQFNFSMNLSYNFKW